MVTVTGVRNEFAFVAKWITTGNLQFRKSAVRQRLQRRQDKEIGTPSYEYGGIQSPFAYQRKKSGQTNSRFLETKSFTVVGVESIKPVLPEIYAVFVHSHHGTDIYFQLFLVWKNIVFFFSSDIFPDSVRHVSVKQRHEWYVKSWCVGHIFALWPHDLCNR